MWKKIIIVNGLFSILAPGCTGTKNATTPTGQSLEEFTRQGVAHFQSILAFEANVGTLKKVSANLNQNDRIIDVRRYDQYRVSRVPGAVNMPFDKFGGFADLEINADLSQLTTTGTNFVYCYEQDCNLATKAALLFNSRGYPTVEVKGGWKSWTEHKYPIEVDDMTKNN